MLVFISELYIPQVHVQVPFSQRDNFSDRRINLYESFENLMILFILALKYLNAIRSRLVSGNLGRDIVLELDATWKIGHAALSILHHRI